MKFNKNKVQSPVSGTSKAHRSIQAGAGSKMQRCRRHRLPGEEAAMSQEQLTAKKN